MKKVVDLIHLSDELKKGKPLENTPPEAKKEQEVKEDIISDIIEEKIILNDKNRENSRDFLKGVRKYMKFEDGKIKYIKDENEKASNPKKIKDILNKDNINKEIEKKKKYFDKQSFLNILIIAFILVSALFIYFYYFSDSNGNIEVATNPGVLANMTQEELNKSNPNTSNDINYTKDTLIKAIGDEIRSTNTKELQKVSDYLELKANRGSSVSTIEKHKSNKESLYILLIENKSLFSKDEESYQSIENLIVKSVAMSEEFLTAFDSSSTKTVLKEVIEKYK